MRVIQMFKCFMFARTEVANVCSYDGSVFEADLSYLMTPLTYAHANMRRYALHVRLNFY